jgi:hypothetical protein
MKKKKSYAPYIRAQVVCRRRIHRRAPPARGILGPRMVDVRLPGKANADSHDARPVRLIISMIKWIQFNPNEVCCTNSLILLVKNMLCIKLHCQKSSNLINLPYRIAGGRNLLVRVFCSSRLTAGGSADTCVHVYMCIHICIYMYLFTYIYILDSLITHSAPAGGECVGGYSLPEGSPEASLTAHSPST